MFETNELLTIQWTKLSVHITI